MSAPHDPPPPEAARLLRQAQSALGAGRLEEAERLLADCLDRAPRFAPARREYAMVLQRQGLPASALDQIDILLRDEPHNAAYREFKATTQSRLGDYAQSLAGYGALLEERPADARLWLRYGHVLKTVGRTPDAVAAYRRSIGLGGGGEVYWSLADLKTVNFDETELAAMRAALATSDPHARIPLHFALGKALEDRRDHAGAFAQYTLGNAARRAGQPYDHRGLSALVARAKSLFTPEFFAERTGAGSPAPDPIFIVGLPRSGSTLVEQILASHPAIEGTSELPDMPAVARALHAGRTDYPSAFAAADADQLCAAGKAYLVRARAHRRLGRPFFIDKMPNNFIHTGLIHLILPNARIIDVRRDALDCCVSCFKQHFAVGQEFSYGLEDIGRYYTDYVALMAHFDAMLPGRVHRVSYETLLADPEREIRRMLDYCGVPFAETCLRFHENDRPVRTASAEQVRRPLSAAGVGGWRRFEPWLGPLKAALAPVLDAAAARR